MQTDWLRFESTIGFALPADYKLLVETYGLGTFGRFLMVYQPRSDYEFTELRTQIRMNADKLEFLAEFEPLPYAPEELVPVAGTDNGNSVYWLRSPLDSPDSWRIVVDQSRGDTWSEFSGGIVDFLVAAFVDGVRFDALAENIGPDPVFTPSGRGEA
ncbi:SMI1/KNR4 family protein [Plantactinospora sp. S1510]|uniref:SMI1/KNR4 family protein n=1 Tax=Plantactinospora alkalitolerans TaxID=2789879 RepID=A0ABS0HAG4_9ACTN|nr:SMI1/KNR4 family protein [Plantactinospora alkalitolerans]